MHPKSCWVVCGARVKGGCVLDSKTHPAQRKNEGLGSERLPVGKDEEMQNSAFSHEECLCVVCAGIRSGGLLKIGGEHRSPLANAVVTVQWTAGWAG